MLDLLEYNHLIEDEGFILFLEFFKAFDTVEHKFIFSTLELFGFGENFINMIKLIYKDTNSAVILPQGTCPRFSVNRGIKQGCPISPLLFITAAEMLSILIKNIDFENLMVFGKQLAISQLADDTTIFMKNTEQIPKVLNTINFFSKASGLKLNLKKCELLPIHSSPLTTIHNIPVKSTVKYLGIHITKDINTLDNLNIWNTLDKCKSYLNMWSQRDISIIGRIFLTKMECLSRFIYPADSLSLSKSAIKTINQANFNYIWNRKTHYIRKGITVKRYEEGGLKAIDIDCINGTIKINWLRSLLRDENSQSFYIPNHIFMSLGGINFLLRCDFDLKKIPIKLSAFHQQVLLYWKMIFKHNFSPHNTPLWNCRYVLLRNKSIFYQNWLEKGIWSVMHLLHNTGNIIPFAEFCSKFNLNDRRQYNNIIKAIPQSIIIMSSNLLQSNINPNLPSLLVNGHNLNSLKLPNVTIRQIFIKELYPFSTNRNSILQLFSKKEAENLRAKFFKYPIAPKMKEVHFKILNGIYPSAEFLRCRFGFEHNNCSFCDDEIETTEHLFYDCKFINVFWEDLHDWLFPKFVNFSNLTKENILYGIPVKDPTHDLGINTIIILANFFIHKNKFMKTKTQIYVFHKELCHYFSSLKCMEKKTAVKLRNLVEELNFTEFP